MISNTNMEIDISRICPSVYQRVEDRLEEFYDEGLVSNSQEFEQKLEEIFNDNVFTDEYTFSEIIPYNPNRHLYSDLITDNMFRIIHHLQEEYEIKKDSFEGYLNAYAYLCAREIFEKRYNKDEDDMELGEN